MSSQINILYGLLVVGLLVSCSTKEPGAETESMIRDTSRSTAQPDYFEPLSADSLPEWWMLPDSLYESSFPGLSAIVPHAGDLVIAAKPALKGMGRKEIARSVYDFFETHAPQLFDLYEAARKKALRENNIQLKGKLQVEFVVSPAGKAARVTIRENTVMPALSDEFVRRVRGFSFAKNPHGEVIVRHTLVYTE